MKSLPEYAESLTARDDLIWPRPRPPKAVNAKPYSAQLHGIRAVVWDVYGTLLQTSDGGLEYSPKPEIRLEVALEKTIHEFNMWNSMTRKPGKPSAYMMQQYLDVLEDERMRGGGELKRGDVAHINLARVWQVLIGRLQQKEYEWDVGEYGGLEDLSQRVAFFFHSALQGVAAYDRALKVVRFLAKNKIPQGLISDAQPYTLIHLIQSLMEQGKLPAIQKVFQRELMVFSFATGTRKPSKSLYEDSVKRFSGIGIGVDEVLYVSSKLKDDLEIAKSVGFKTCLFAGDDKSIDAPKELISSADTRPDRLITNLGQIARIIGGEPG